MNYRYLSNSLHVTADRVAKYIRHQHGATGLKCEEPLDDSIPYRPTIQASLGDHHHLCVEVTDGKPGQTLSEFVLECIRKNLPVRLYLALPAGLDDGIFSHNVKFARKWSIGILQVAENGCEEIVGPVSLSLAGLRDIDRSAYPASYRQPLAVARNTFVSGDPSKGCGLIYDEIEDLSRKVAKKTFDKGYWKSGASLPAKYKTCNWGPFLDQMLDNIDFQKCRADCPLFTREVIARVCGVKDYRNDSGHKPKSSEQLLRRDRELRTRFESAADLLLDLVNATRPWRV